MHRTINDINFSELYQSHFQLASREPKQPADWDQKAEKMQTSSFDLHNAYVHAFLSRMQLSPNDTLLDVGCGAGAIALSVAPQVKQVYALDFSPKMLDVLQRRAESQCLHNITPILRAWEENWGDLPECDICVSSRSSMVGDLHSALAKLNAKAQKAVYMTMTVEKDFIQRDILRHIGRDGVGFPSYIYAVNLLYQQGYRVKVDFIEHSGGMVEPQPLTEAEFIQTVAWSIGDDLTATEQAKLKSYYAQHPEHRFVYPAERVWAFLSWETGRNR